MQNTKRVLAAGLLLCLLFVRPAARATRYTWEADGDQILTIHPGGDTMRVDEVFDYGEDGLVSGTHVMMTITGENGSGIVIPWTRGDGTDVIEQVIGADPGWLCVGSSSSSNLADGYHPGSYDGKEAKSDAWALRLGARGDVLWSRKYGGDDWDAFHAVCGAADGGWVCAGNTHSAGGDVAGWHDSGDLFIQPDGWLVSLDEDGAIRWQLAPGGAGFDELRGVAETPAGYLAVGITDSQDGDVSGPRGDRDAWAVCVDAQGSLRWSRTYGGGGEDRFLALAAGPGGYLAAGTSWSFEAGQAREAAWAVLLDAAGEVLWTQRFGGTEPILQPQKAAWADDGWIISGIMQVDGEEADWRVRIPPDGGAWEALRGAL